MMEGPNTPPTHDWRVTPVVVAVAPLVVTFVVTTSSTPLKLPPGVDTVHPVAGLLSVSNNSLTS